MAPRPPAALLAIPLLLLVVPGAAGLAYAGPGQTGTVRLGDDGALASLGLDLPAPLADNLSEVRLDGLPADACRLVLDQNGTYAATHALWTPGLATARVYAAAGTTNAAFRVHALWHTDLNGHCTAEETEDGILWHDPRGRAYVEMVVLDRRPVVDGARNSTIDVTLRIHNNGTVPDNVTGRLARLPDGWSGASSGATTAVPVAPLATVGFPFRLHIPDGPQSRLAIVRVAFSATDWNAEVPVFVQFDEATPAPAASKGAKAPGTPDAAPPPAWTPSAEAPAPPFLLGVLALGLIARRARRPAPAPA